MITEPTPIVGVDIAKDKFDVCLDLDAKSLRCELPNTESGVIRLVTRLAKAGDTAGACRVCLAATGVYSRLPCALLHEKGFTVHLENPARIAAHAKALGKRSKTDSEDAFVIADYCRANLAKLHAWSPPAKNIVRLRALHRRREQHGLSCRTMSIGCLSWVRVSRSGDWWPVSKTQTRDALAAVGAEWQRDYCEHRLRPDESADAYAAYIF